MWNLQVIGFFFNSEQAVSAGDSVLTAMGLSGFTQYYADPGGPCGR